MVPRFDSAHENRERLDGGSGKGWGCGLGACAAHPPTQCDLSPPNQEVLPGPHWMFSQSPLLLFGPKHSPRDASEGRPNISTTEVHTRWLRSPWQLPPSLRTVLCVHESDLQASPSASANLQDPARSSSKPQWEQIRFLPSGDSLIQLLHITRFLGRDWRVAVRAVNVRRWPESGGKCQHLFWCILQRRYLEGHCSTALLNSPSSSCRADSKMWHGSKF